MKVAAAEALAKLAREDVPDEVDRAYSGRRLRYGPEYVVPVPFDPRLISAVSSAVAQAAMDSGVARKPIADMAEYRRDLSGRLDPTSHWLQSLFEQVKANPQRIVFAEGEEERTIRAAVVFRDNGYGTPILIGREEQVRETMKALGINDDSSMEIHNARLSTRNAPYTDLVYKRLQRDGYLRRDVQRMVNQGRNVFGACMVAMGDADGMVTGITRRFPECYADVKRVIDIAARQGADRLLDRRGAPRHGVPGRHLDQRDAVGRAARHHRPPDGEERPHHGPRARVAFLSFSNFGSREIERIDRIRKAIRILAGREGRLRVRRRDAGRHGARLRAAARDLSVLPPHRPGQRAGDAGPAFGAHLLAPDAAAGRRHGDRPGDRRPAEAGPDRADGRHGERPREPRRAGGLRRAQRTEVAMYDLVIRGATIVDGLGHEPRRADLAVKDGRIADHRRDQGQGRRDVDAGGLVLSPGIVDVHTHYDAQVTWDTTLSPSPSLGVTTAVIGNCGFGIVPAPPAVRDLVIRNLSVVEGMDLDALRQGIAWDFESFGDYMAMLRRRGAYANLAVLAGHSTIRTAVMGEAASQRADATPEELAKMKAMVADAMAHGAIGLGASYSLNHSGYGGVPMPSTIAPMSELDALVGAMGPRGQGVIAIASGVKTPEELEPMAAKHGRPFFQGTGMAMYNEQEPAARARHLRRLRRRPPARQRPLRPDPLPAAVVRLHDGQRLPVLQPLGLRPDQGFCARAARRPSIAIRRGAPSSARTRRTRAPA